MGHWEQIGERNRRWRERQASLPRWRRLDGLGYSMSVLAFIFWGGLA
jgi:hypothetical protein